MSLVPDDEYTLYTLDDDSEIIISSRTTIVSVYFIKRPKYGRRFGLRRDDAIDLFARRYPPSVWKRVTGFFDFGKLKDFRIRYEAVGDEILAPVLTFHKSYLTRLENSPEIPEPNIETLYGIDFILTTKTELKPAIRIKKITEIYKHHWCLTMRISVISTSIDELNMLREKIGESRLVGVGIYVAGLTFIGDCHFEYLIEADPESKTILEKLIYIYSHIRDFLTKNNITLKDIFEDIDLYVSIAAAAAAT